MKRFARLSIIFILMLTPLFAAAQSFKNAQSVVLAHTWGSQRLPGAIWGITSSDVDGDGKGEIVFLKHNAVVVGTIDDKGFHLKSQYEWDGLLEGVRLYAMNLDDDPAEEIIISAVEGNHPSSFALKWNGTKFEEIFSKAPWHLRVLQDNIGKLLVGQQWTTTSFFEGSIYFLSLNGKKLKRGERVPLPKWATIYNFEGLDADSRIVRMDPYKHVEVYEKNGKKYRKIWSSGGRFGGGLNVVDFEAREPLGEADQEGVIINREPLVTSDNGAPLIFGVEHDVPLKGIIGRRAWIPRSKIVAFGEDPSLGFQNKFETEEIQGYIADYTIFNSSCVLSLRAQRSNSKGIATAPPATTASAGRSGPRNDLSGGHGCSNKLIVPVQLQSSMWRENQESALLMFDLPQ